MVIEGILILGMHRSGTSCLTGMLKEYGLHLGKVGEKKKGNHENPAVYRINDRLLALHKGKWTEPQPVRQVPATIKEEIEAYKESLRIGLTENHRVWGIKDPRMLFCWRAWADDSTAFVATMRHPLSVAHSLKRRHETTNPYLNRPLREWMHLWYLHNLELLSLYQSQPFPIVNFDWPTERYCKAVENIAGHFNIKTGECHFFDPSSRSQADCDEPVPEEYDLLYKQLTEIAEHEEMALAQSIKGQHL